MPRPRLASAIETDNRPHATGPGANDNEIVEKNASCLRVEGAAAPALRTADSIVLLSEIFFNQPRSLRRAQHNKNDKDKPSRENLCYFKTDTETALTVYAPTGEGLHSKPDRHTESQWMNHLLRHRAYT